MEYLFIYHDTHTNTHILVTNITACVCVRACVYAFILQSRSHTYIYIYIYKYIYIYIYIYIYLCVRINIIIRFRLVNYRIIKYYRHNYPPVHSTIPYIYIYNLAFPIYPVYGPGYRLY